MDTSQEYIKICKMAFEIQGKICTNKTKDQLGILQQRGLKKGDWVVHAKHSMFNEAPSRWSEEIFPIHVDFKVINEEDRDIFYLSGEEKYVNSVSGFIIGQYYNEIQWNFPIWDEECFNEKIESEIDFWYYLSLANSSCIWWLPRQDQLQELSHYKNQAWASVLLDMWNSKDNYFAFRNDATQEKISLILLMKEKYNKIWNGNDWIIT